MNERSILFEDWMKEHLGVLHRISRAFSDPADQHDLMQELMLAAWKAIPAFRGGSEPSTFIYRVALNRALTWRKNEQGRKRRAAACEVEWHALMSQPADPAEAALLDRLYAAIRQLRPLDRSLILLALEKVRHSDIGQIHQLTETNVAVRLNRARQQISALVQEQDDEL